VDKDVCGTVACLLFRFSDLISVKE